LQQAKSFGGTIFPERKGRKRRNVCGGGGVVAQTALLMAEEVLRQWRDEEGSMTVTAFEFQPLYIYTYITYIYICIIWEDFFGFECTLNELTLQHKRCEQ
jgi:hypothetical protein